ncbi:SLBB domain-containing protein [Pseudanabaena sp. FACHB-2040]|nr:SLBB domain-containing protein [Pseudanabaena sp. FACHB-2040]
MQSLPLAPSRAVAPPPQADSSYSLGAGDIVRVDLFRLPQYSGEQQVQADGSLNLPLVGRVSVFNMTLEQASSTISNAYSQVLRRPIVALTLLQRRPLTVGIAGEVNRPGAYTLSNETTSFPTLARLLETAEGVTQSADLQQVEVRRQTAQGTQTITVDLWQLLRTGDSRYDIALRDGDSVFIPSTQVSLEDGMLLANASFAASSTQPVNISVVGEVFRPGPYTLRGGPTRTGQAGVPGGEAGSNSSTVNRPVTVTDAIQVAGGIKPMANLRQVQVRRFPRSGSEQVFTVDLWQLLSTGDLRQNPILQEGDTVIIPTATSTPSALEAAQLAEASFSPNTIRINVVGEVKQSGLLEMPPNTSLNQALLAAGGFNNRARQDTVLLVRLNPDGTVIRQPVEVNFAEGIDEANNPALRNNDVVIVERSGLAGVSDTLGLVADPISRFLNLFTLPFRIFN